MSEAGKLTKEFTGSRSPTRQQDFLRALGVAVLYYLIARVSLLFIIQPEGFAVIWPPSGFILAVLLLTERRSWLITMTAVFMAVVLANLYAGNTFGVSFGFALANSVEPLIAASLLNRFVTTPIRFNKIRDITGFVLVAVMVSNAFTALVGAAVPALGKGTPYWRAWLVWFVEDGVGMLILTPLIVTLARERVNIFKNSGLIEFAALLGAIAAVTLLSFGFAPERLSIIMRPELVMPLLILMAIRFKVAGAALALLLVALLSILLTKLGMGPFTVSGHTTSLGIISLQVSLWIASFAILILAATIVEREALSNSLKKSQLLLNETEQIGKVGGWEFNIDTGEQTWTEEIYNIHELDRAHNPTVERGVEFYTPASKPIIQAAVQRAIECSEPFDLELDIITAKGNLKSVHAIGRADIEHRRVYGFFQDITERKRTDEQIKRSLEEKTVMLKEIHHRVKNNMQVIYSLLSLQAKSIADETVRDNLEESKNRVKSMAMIHERLYRSADLAHIEFKDYLKSLAGSIANTYRIHDVAISVDMEPVFLDVNMGIPCGLIVNELLSNSLKYAFPEGKKGTVKVGINRDGEGNYVLFVEDNGIGFPAEIDFLNTKTLGLELVKGLTRQINGKAELSRGAGTRFSITFPDSADTGGQQNG
ncbi:MAG: MASE1 domain-containing protein [Nitrospirae bacterium]|nr:MASE1 domain-containing protein [Nitrospirota bacterium]